MAGWGPAAFAAAYSSSVLNGGKMGPKVSLVPCFFSNSLTLVDLWIMTETSRRAPLSMTCFEKVECAPKVVNWIDCVSRLSYPKNFFFFRVKSSFFSFSPASSLPRLAV